jgi:anti-sigma regulatory factor (Ser/Thr protein kinase)
MTQFPVSVGAAAPLPTQQRAETTWPLQSYLELGALPTAVPCARLHSRQMAREWDLEALIEGLELIVSELVTNAVRATDGLVGSHYEGCWEPGVPPVRLWLCSDSKRVAVQVWDANHQLPVRQEVEPEAESGRGLLLVESLSVEWGAYRPEECDGKVVWAIIA